MLKERSSLFVVTALSSLSGEKKKGFIMETMALENYPDQKVDCPYCKIFDKEKLKQIEERELKNNE